MKDRLYVLAIGGEGYLVMREGTALEREQMLKNNISPRFAMCDSLEDAERIVAEHNACLEITTEALEENVIHDSIMLAQKMFDERFEQVTQKKDQMFNLVKVWEGER